MRQCTMLRLAKDCPFYCMGLQNVSYNRDSNILNLNGEWNIKIGNGGISEGTMKLHHTGSNVSGTYKITLFNNVNMKTPVTGRIFAGSLWGRSMKGRWINESTNKQGYVKFDFKPYHDKDFEGNWGYTDQYEGGSWTGWRW